MTISEKHDNYRRACVDGIYKNITNAADGARNETLNSEGFRLFQAASAGDLSEQQAIELLTEAAQILGLKKDEYAATIRSAKRGLANPKPFPFKSNDIDEQERLELHRLAAQLRATGERPQKEREEILSKNNYSMNQLNMLRGNKVVSSEYLTRKKLMHHANMFFSGNDKHGNFVAHPLYGFNGTNYVLVGYERIYAEGKKVSGGANIHGVYFGVIAKGQYEKPCYVTEGFADALTIHDATGCDVFCAISAGNMGKVATLIGDKYPSTIIAIDNDKAGQKHGEKLMNDYQCVMPVNENEDFNDVYVRGGDVAAELTNEFKLKSMDVEHETISLAANVKAEQNLLALVLNNINEAKEIAELLHSQLLSVPQHKIVLTAIKQLLNNNVNLDFITLESQLNADNALESIGGTGYLQQLFDFDSNQDNWRDHIGLLHAKYKHDEAIRLAGELQHGRISYDEMLAQLEKISKEACFEKPSPLENQPSLGEPLSKDIIPIDWLCHGEVLPRGHVTTIPAHNGAGKTQLSIQIAIQLAMGRVIMKTASGNKIFEPKNAHKVLIATFEDDTKIYVERIKRTIENYPNFNYSIKGAIKKLDENLIVLDMPEAYGSQAMLTEMISKTKLGITQAYIHLRDFIKKNDIDLVFVDPAHYTTDAIENDNNLQAQHIELMKQIAKECNCALILMAHTTDGNPLRLRGATSIVDKARQTFQYSTIVRMKQHEKMIPVEVINPQDLPFGIDYSRVSWLRKYKNSYGKKNLTPYYLEMNDDGLLVPFDLPSAEELQEKKQSKPYSRFEEKMLDILQDSKEKGHTITSLRVALAEIGKDRKPSIVKEAVTLMIERGDVEVFDGTEVGERKGVRYRGIGPSINQMKKMVNNAIERDAQKKNNNADKNGDVPWNEDGDESENKIIEPEQTE